MSHIVQLATKIHDPIAITAACRRLGLIPPLAGTARLFSGEATGLLLQLPGWTYPAVIDHLTGAIRYDNFEGRWGETRQLDRFMQMYAVEKAKLEAHHRGFRCSEQALPGWQHQAADSRRRLTVSRRQIIRPVATPIRSHAVDSRRLAKLRERLEVARKSFKRWLSRLQRASRALDKQQHQIARLERQIQRQEEC